MTLSSELFPAPLGPMIARTSCSRTSKLMSVSAFTPPKESEMLLSLRMASSTAWCPVAIGASVLGSSRQRRASGGHRRDVFDPQVGGDHTTPSILEPNQRLDVLNVAPGVQGVDQHRVLVSDEATAHLAGARQFLIVWVELLVQDKEAADLRRTQRGI